MSAVLDFPVKPEARDYLARFARDPGEPGWLAARRQQAMTRFAELGFPSRRSEGWRYLDLQPLERQALLPVGLSGRASQAALGARLAALAPPGRGPRLVLADGRFVPALSTLALPEGAWLGSIVQAVQQRSELAEAALAETGDDATRPFAALNAAFFSDGYILDVAPGIVLDEPIVIAHLASGAAAASFHTRSLVRLGAGAGADIIEIYAGDGRYWRNDIVAARLDDGAALGRAAVVEEAGEAVHLAQLDATLGAGARLAAFSLLLGGHRVRQETNVRLSGDGAHCRLDGAYLVDGGDEANIVTTVDHAAPGGQTRELIKGVAADRGHGAFQGRIIVREHAQKTDAHQLSRNLMIGRRAVIDTKPELEIYADDVKCAHGASVGDLDENVLFYLLARGIPAEEARRMLVEGFLRDAVDGVDARALREHLLRRLAARLDHWER